MGICVAQSLWGPWIFRQDKKDNVGCIGDIGRLFTRNNKEI